MIISRTPNLITPVSDYISSRNFTDHYLTNSDTNGRGDHNEKKTFTRTPSSAHLSPMRSSCLTLQVKVQSCYASVLQIFTLSPIHFANGHIKACIFKLAQVDFTFVQL